MFRTRICRELISVVLYFLRNHSCRMIVGSISEAINILWTYDDDDMTAAATAADFNEDDSNCSTPANVPFGRTLVAGSLRAIM